MTKESCYKKSKLGLSRTSEVKVLGMTVQMVKFASLPKSWSSKWKVQTSSTKVAKMSGTAKKRKNARRSGAPSNP